MPYSVSPNGERFPLPEEKDCATEFVNLRQLVSERKNEGYKIVVVMGLGFVGAVMAAVVADSVDSNTGWPGKFVIGMQRPSTRSYWKIPLFNQGICPVKAEDPEVAQIIHRCVVEKQNLVATYTNEVLQLADGVVVVDIQCDFIKLDVGIFVRAMPTSVLWRKALRL